MSIDPIVAASPTSDSQSGAGPSARPSTLAPARMPPDRIEKVDARGAPSQTYNADVLLHNSLGGAHALVASAAGATFGAVQRVGPALSQLGPEAASAATAAAGAAASIAGETLGAAGLVVAMQSSAGDAGEDAPDATWRQHSNAVADRTPQQVHTTFPGYRVDVGPNHTTNPAHVRPAKDGILTTPAETSTKVTHTGHAAPELRELTIPTGTAVHQPRAMDQATFSKQERVVTPAHTAHLTASGSLMNADRAIVPAEKLSGYALNPAHAQGGNKARLFQATLGMDASHAHDLETQLRDGIKTKSAIPGDVDEHGVRFAVDVPVVGPKGSATVRSSWIYKSNSEEPSLTSVRVKIK